MPSWQGRLTPTSTWSCISCSSPRSWWMSWWSVWRWENRRRRSLRPQPWSWGRYQWSSHTGGYWEIPPGVIRSKVPGELRWASPSLTLWGLNTENVNPENQVLRTFEFSRQHVEARHRTVWCTQFNSSIQFNQSHPVQNRNFSVKITIIIIINSSYWESIRRQC